MAATHAVIDTALILAAGLGTRLAPLSAVRAKAALPVAGEALIRRQVQWLAASGVRQVIVNLHHLPATITAVVGHGDDLGVTVRYSWEPVLLGSAGGPRQAFDLVAASQLIVVNGDTLTDLDLAALEREHARTPRLVTLAATAARPGYNALRLDASGALIGVRRAADGAAASSDDEALAHFMGVQVVERRTFDEVPRGTPSETVKWLYPRLAAADPASVRVWRHEATFFDVGTPAEYLRTAHAMATREGRPLDRGANTVVDPAADVSGSLLWNDVRVGAGASVRDCVLADGVVVPPGMRIARAAVVRHALAPQTTGARHGDLLVVPFDATSK